MRNMTIGIGLLAIATVAGSALATDTIVAARENKAAVQAQAETQAQAEKPGCAMQEQVSISISFNSQVESPKLAKQRFDEKLAAVDAAAKELKFQKWSLQSMNYSVSPYNSGYGEGNYQISGSVSYQTDNADLAFTLMEQLSKQKMQANVSVSSYRNGNCNER